MANGTAYALLTCDDSQDKDKIVPAMNTFREVMSTPSGLELTLQDISDLHDTATLRALNIPFEIFAEAQRMSRKGAKYLVKAQCPDLTNKVTAGETASLLNPASYDIQGLDGNIYFKDEKGQYQRWE
ncbi:MAG: hypothetical protein Q7R96_05635 [Nanoarchaeota archaeon]|nr:hypothetical protein [Nanoarchaeota archaeon]